MGESAIGTRQLRTAVVSVSYNTRELTAPLLWSLLRVLAPPAPQVLFVDNGSTDGSMEMLRAAAEAGLCGIVDVGRNVGHGPGLNIGIERLLASSVVTERVWILDSDCVVARADVLLAIDGDPTTGSAAVVGEPHFDQWQNRDRFGLYSLVVDLPAALSLRDVLFGDGGDPSIALLNDIERAGLPVASFPFTADSYVIHRGRGTLASVFQRQEGDNPLFAWAADHHEPHFGNVQGATARYQTLVESLTQEVAVVDGHHLAAALRPATNC